MQIVDVTELGRRVRALRLQRGMTLKQVESLCGLSATHLSEVERGRTSPTLGALTRTIVQATKNLCPTLVTTVASTPVVTCKAGGQ